MDIAATAAITAHLSSLQEHASPQSSAASSARAFTCSTLNCCTPAAKTVTVCCWLRNVRQLSEPAPILVLLLWARPPQGHDDDIRCMSIHPDRFIVATGQISSSLDGSYAPPFVCIWDTRNVHQLIKRIDLEDVKPKKENKERDFSDPTQKGPQDPRMRSIVALAFSGDGNRLVVIAGDNRHTVHVFYWKSRTPSLISSDVGHNGEPPQVRMRASTRMRGRMRKMVVRVAGGESSACGGFHSSVGLSAAPGPVGLQASAKWDTPRP